MGTSSGRNVTAAPAPRKRASAAAELRSPAEGKLLKPKPRYCEINAGDHRQWGNDPRTACPEPAKAIWQKCGNQADNESADRSKSSPSVPIHLGREEIQDRIGNIPGTMRAQKHNGLRGVNGKQREAASMCKSIEQRESCCIRRRTGDTPNWPLLVASKFRRICL